MSPKLRRSVPRSLMCSTLAIALVLAPSVPVLAAEATAAAEPSAGDPEALSAAAVERFEAKDYDGAVSLFEQAYAADPNPNYLFNIGRVYEEKGDLKKAIEQYQKFLGQSGVDLESRQAATDRLKVLREAVAQLEADDAPPEDTPPGDDVTTEPAADDPATATEEADQKAAKRKKTLRITGYSLLGVGGVGLIVGGVFGGLARGSVNDADADPFVDRQQAFRERARSQARVADAMFITGGVLAATGLVLVLVTLGKKKSTTDVDAKTTWTPVLGPQQVGLGLSRRF